MQIDLSAIKPTCSPFLSMSYARWLAWLHGRTLTSPKRSKQDVAGILETGLGILNSTDIEVLGNKVTSATGNLHRMSIAIFSVSIGN